jgi:16S rRNA (guanine527-N7)-methyltransferase
MDEKGFTARLLEATGKMGISFSNDQAQLCAIHVRLMLEWNARTNLTRITSEHDILVKHILDSLIPAQWLPSSGILLDVGTGPGFPGIPLKILYPGLDLVLLEAVRKKASFLTILLQRLGLKSARALHGRWEDMGRIEHPMASKFFNLIVMRAVRLEKEHVNDFAPRMLDSGGILAWWAGPAAFDEISRYRALSERRDFSFHCMHSYELPGGSGPRHLLIWKKV